MRIANRTICVWFLALAVSYSASGCGYLGTYYNKRIVEDARVQARRLIKAGRYAEAHKLLDGALCRLSSTDALEQALLFEQLAELNCRENRFEAAKSNFCKARDSFALAFAQSPKIKIVQAIISERIAQIDLNMGRLALVGRQPAEAVPYLKRAVGEFENSSKLSLDLCAQRGLQESLLARADAADMLHDIGLAERSRQRAKQLDDNTDEVLCPVRIDLVMLHDLALSDREHNRFGEAAEKLKKIYFFTASEAPGTRAHMEASEDFIRALAINNKQQEAASLIQSDLPMFRRHQKPQYLALWELEMVPILLKSGNVKLAKEMVTESMQLALHNELNKYQLECMHGLGLAALANFADLAPSKELEFALNNICPSGTKLEFLDKVPLLEARTHAARLLLKNGDAHSAAMELEKVYRIQMRFPKKEPPHSAAVWLELADDAWKKSDVPTTRLYARRACEINTPGAVHFCSIEARCAYLLDATFAYQEAQKAIAAMFKEFKRSTHSYSDEEVAWMYAYAACVEYAAGNPALAEDYWEKANSVLPKQTAIQIKNLATMQQTVFDCRWNDLLRLHKDDPAKAIAFGRKAVQMRRAAFGPDSDEYKQSIDSLERFIKQVK
jgi:tetratricopeptide (TPR) repeat protein